MKTESAIFYLVILTACLYFAVVEKVPIAAAGAFLSLVMLLLGAAKRFSAWLDKEKSKPV